MEFIFNPNNKHILPTELVSASDALLAIGGKLIKLGLFLTLHKKSINILTTGYSVLAEINERYNEKIKVIVLGWDEGNNSFASVDSSLRILNEGELFTPDEILDFCVNYVATKKVIQDIDLCSSEYIQPGDHYVYRHIFKDGRIYIGKGTGKRWLVTSDRNNYYDRSLKENGAPHIEKLIDNVSEDTSYKLEAIIIEANTRSLPKGFVLNQSHGMERASDIGDMPMRTIFVMENYMELNLNKVEYQQRVNIFKRSTLELGSSKEVVRQI